jgi:hippurate hydrolase
MKQTIIVLVFLVASSFAADTWRAPSQSQIDAIYPSIETFYEDLHRNPELSLHEEKTATRMAEQLRKLGFDVTTGVGGTGVVGVLKNGAGPTVLLRAELDALPVEEKTGLPYASTVRTKDDLGRDVPVMHACGHDIHMAVGIGMATLMSQNKDKWHGTIVFVGQPAEEMVKGADNMLKDGLLTRFPHPDYALSIHDGPTPAGTIGYTMGYALANSDAVEVTVYGKGGHGSRPQVAIDPILIAARMIVAWQTIVSRENDPFDPAVITVGQIHAGTRGNIIPDEVHMSLTVRSYKKEVRDHLLSAIERIAKAEAMAAGAPKPPKVELVESVSAVFNDPKVMQRVVTELKKIMGDANVEEEPPAMAADDFAEYGRAGIPSVDLWVGAIDPAKFAAAKKSGETLPGLHSSLWAPDREPTLKTGIEAETAAMLELLSQKQN